MEKATPFLNRLVLCLAALGCVLALSAPRAAADSIQYALTTGNIGGLDCCAGPYATVTIDLTSSTTATVTFDSLTNGGYIYLMGDGGTADLNVNGAYTLGAVSESNSIAGFTPTYISNTPGVVDGFGTFNLSLNNFDGFTDSATEVSFTLTLNSGSWASASSVLTGNDKGQLAAIHGFACVEPGCSTTSGAAYTGFASGAQVTPEPVSMVLMGTFLFAAYALLRRRISA